MGLSGFCRNCLADWIRDAGFAGGKMEARALIHGMPFDEWKAKYQTEATPGQIARMEKSLKKNGGTHCPGAAGSVRGFPLKGGVTNDDPQHSGTIPFLPPPPVPV